MRAPSPSDRRSSIVAAALVLTVGCGGLPGDERPDREAPAQGDTHAVPAPADAPLGMVWIPGGELAMGSPDGLFEDAVPVHPVRVDGFYLDATEVTNAQFAEFVAATGWMTLAERVPRAEDFPQAPPENLVAGSVVFTPPRQAVALDDPLQWWAWVPGADWRHPRGPGSSIEGLDDHPVVHVAWEDAAAYAEWAGKRLPTEAEWEWAARGGLVGARYVWGDDFRPDGVFLANSFQGHFPDRNSGEDGFLATNPVEAFPPNGYGLYGMAGNVWEWTSDWYRPDTYAQRAARGGVAENPKGPSEEESWDPQEPGVAKRVQRGGSFLCTDQYCTRYRPDGRGKGAVDTGTDHLGFRLAADPAGGPVVVSENEQVRDRGEGKDRWWEALPRAAWNRFEQVPVGQDWFEVYRVHPDVLAIYEPGQFEEVISYLVLGEQRALLFDTGLGIGDLRALVSELTELPVVVLNSHTHYDHVGGNHQFDEVWAADTDFTRRSAAGRAHQEVAEFVGEGWIWKPPPAGFRAEEYVGRPFEIARTVEDGTVVDLGGRRLEVLLVPGHAPDALCLLDRESRLLFVGDTYYPAPLYAHLPGSDFELYRQSAKRLAGLVGDVDYLLPGHNEPLLASPALVALHEAFELIARGEVRYELTDGNREYSFGAFSILTKDPV